MNNKRLAVAMTTCMTCSMLLAGCGNRAPAASPIDEVKTENESAEIEESGDGAQDESENVSDVLETTDMSDEDDRTSRLADVMSKNDEAFAWIYVPGTQIDYPVFQSTISDDFYITHDEYKNETDSGAAYIWLGNMKDMCDFNTVIHGADEQGDIFYDIHAFENPDFFENISEIKIYLPDNELTYTIFAAYYDDGSEILTQHDYTTVSGCQEYLDELYDHRSMDTHIREDWHYLTPYHFLLTLTGEVHNGQRYVVTAALTEDKEDTIDRVFLGDSEDFDFSFLEEE